jgi:hypothetical protein
MVEVADSFAECGCPTAQVAPGLEGLVVLHYEECEHHDSLICEICLEDVEDDGHAEAAEGE